MTPLFYEDSLGARLAEKAHDAIERVGSADDELIDDPAALEAAQAEVNTEDPYREYAAAGSDWVVVLGPTKLSGLLDVAGANACVITMPLDAEGIPYVWDPYPPEEMPGATNPYRVADRPFSLLVAPQNAAAARSLLAAVRPGASLPAGMPATHALTPQAASSRRELAWTLLVIFFGTDLLIALGYGLYRAFHFFSRF